MNKRKRMLPDPVVMRAPLPGWLRAPLATEGIGAVDFLAGASLAFLDGLARDDHLIGSLWRQRLALRVGAAIARLQGRTEEEATLRDHIYLTRSDHDPGPAGRVAVAWRVLALPVTLRNETWSARLPTLFSDVGPNLEEAIAVARTQWGGQGDAVSAAANVAATTLRLLPRQEALALWFADVVLAQRMSWPAAVPMLATQVSRMDLRMATKDVAAWDAACHRAYARAAAAAVDLHGELARASVRLLAVAPQLRSKDADRTVARILSEDALAAPGLTSTDRSGRRLLERLVSLGGLRELTGRASFRLYGL